MINLKTIKAAKYGNQEAIDIIFKTFAPILKITSNKYFFMAVIEMMFFKKL